MLLVPVRVGRSEIHGLGAFAAAPIRRGTAVWRFTPGFDLELDPRALDSLPAPARPTRLPYGYVDARLGRHVPCRDDARFVDHSDTTDPRGDFARERYGVDLAARDIAAGEELTIDYGILERPAAPPGGGR